MPRNRAERRHLQEGETLWCYSDAAEYLACTERKLRDLTYRQRIPFLKVGREIRFRRSELDVWLEENRPVAS